MSNKRCGTWARGDSGEEERGFFCQLQQGHSSKNHSPYPESRFQGVHLGSTVTKLDKEIQDLLTELDRKKKLRETHGANIRVKCLGDTVGRRGCGATFKVSSLTYIQTHWYTPPYSCNGGDYWNLGEGQFKCPTCGTINRLYERPEVVKLQRLFKTTENTY